LSAAKVKARLFQQPGLPTARPLPDWATVRQEWQVKEY